MHRLRSRVLAATLTALPALAALAAPTAGPVGTWMFEDGDSAVALYDCAGHLCGRIAWIKPKPDGTPRKPTDSKNPDPALRARPVCGLTFITGLTRDDEGAWTGGRIYSIGGGSTYDLNLRQTGPDTIRLRGYKGIALLGQSFTLTRAPAGLPACAP